MSRLVQYLIFATALGCGLSAGVFFAFSSFVMPALDRLAPAQSIRAMNALNKLAVTPAFMSALFGTALACVVLGVWALTSWGERSATLALAGCALFLVGAIVVTMAANVPLNDALMRVDPRPPTRRRAGAATCPTGPRGTTCAPGRPSPPRGC
jgi:uncharacterized membrane protein